MAGCSDPLDRVIAVEEKSSDILKDSSSCKAATEEWTSYRKGLAEEGPYEAAFDYAVDIVERTGADSEESKALDAKFCDFLIAHQESAYWFTKGCVESSYFLGMKYSGDNFAKEVRYVNRRLSGMPAGYGTYTRYWTKTCEPRAKEALKALESNK
jgi:hypothetical protein